MNHIIPALLMQLALSPIDWWLGAAFAIAYYLGREMAQAEYRVIQTYYAGKRANMPWWGGFQIRAWTLKSVLDVMFPAIATAFVAFIME